ncbi:MAG: hypothetical protein WAO71_12530 [Gallionella sp.]
MNPLSIKPLYIFPRFTLHCEQVLQNTSKSGIHSVIGDFFTSMVSPMGGMVQQYNTRKGNTARLLFEVLNIPPARFKTGKAQKGVAAMRKEFPRAFARLAVSIPAICAHVAHACKGGAQ